RRPRQRSDALDDALQEGLRLEPDHRRRRRALRRERPHALQARRVGDARRGGRAEARPPRPAASSAAGDAAKGERPRATAGSSSHDESGPFRRSRNAATSRASRKTLEIAVHAATARKPTSGRPAISAALSRIRFGFRRARTSRKYESTGRQQNIEKPASAYWNAASRSRPAT